MKDLVSSQEKDTNNITAESILRCPSCHAGEPLSLANDELRCPACNANFPADPTHGFYALLAPTSESSEKANIQAWWGDLYKQLYEEHEHSLTRDSLPENLKDLEEMFRLREHLAVVEMPLDEIEGRHVLEIGPGGGGHSALFQSKGARVTAADLTPERVVGTAIKLGLSDRGDGRAYQADAENLPFHDATFDIVYSNGVLHHSQNTDRCIAEVMRVLKPGGRAILMLYSRHSSAYWLNIVPRGLFSGEMFRWPEAEWIGRVTEGTPKFGATKNPFTRVYSANQIRNLLSEFTIKHLRKSSFQFDNFAVPRLTQMRNALLRFVGRKPHPGGMLVYGTPYMVETAFELWLGRYVGFAWNIVAEKPQTPTKGSPL
jgi:ubiquinone/menaquinone biosynthesis C-methylase UbiE